MCVCNAHRQSVNAPHFGARGQRSCAACVLRVSDVHYSTAKPLEAIKRPHPQNGCTEIYIPHPYLILGHSHTHMNRLHTLSDKPILRTLHALSENYRFVLAHPFPHIYRLHARARPPFVQRVSDVCVCVYSFVLNLLSSAVKLLMGLEARLGMDFILVCVLEKH